MKSKFWFGVFLTISILLVVRCFEYADAVRGSDQIGTEVFMLVLPLWIVFRQMAMLERKIERKNKYIEKLEAERLNA